MSAPPAQARFDDLTTGTALVFPPPRRVLTTRRPDEVPAVLAAVERAAAAGHWAYGFLAYEAASGLDPGLVTPRPDPDGVPLVWFGVGDPPAAADPVRAPGRSGDHRWSPDWTAGQHASAVAAVREQIAAGETYQCNLTDRLRAERVTDPEALYADLALAQRGAHNAYLDTGRFAIASASPELFFQWRGNELSTRPMKGTAPRGATAEEDRARASALRGSAKEQAENLMIVDLLRNDLGRLAEPGSVRVPALFQLEPYPTVWQLTSEVTARVGADVGLVDVFRALFPCGSVTGAPKHRTMQLIEQLEPTPRGVYCGAIGFVAPPAAPVRARFSVAIRTAVVDRATGRAVYGAGGGITWDSDAAAERAELLTKAAILGGRDHPGEAGHPPPDGPGARRISPGGTRPGRTR